MKSSGARSPNRFTVRAAILSIALLPGLLACLDPGNPFEPLSDGGYHVLFIGNSLTYVNDLPGTVALVAAQGGETIRVRSVALPNYAVIDHALGASNALSVIQSEKWDYVVLQQGPTSTQLNRDTLVIAAKLLDPHIRGAGGRSASLKLVLYERITGKDARSLPARAIAGGRTLDTEETTIRLLQLIAHETSEQFPR